MTNYIPLLEAILERKSIRYSRHEKVVVFFRKYSYGKVEVRMKFAFLLFPAAIEAVVSIPYPLKPEQTIAAGPLIKEANEAIFRGERSTAPNMIACGFAIRSIPWRATSGVRRPGNSCRSS
jgi:hypothetical protein